MVASPLTFRQAIRDQLRHHRRQIPSSSRERATQIIHENLSRLYYTLSPQQIFAYRAMGSEVDVNQWAMSQQRLGCPVYEPITAPPNALNWQRFGQTKLALPSLWSPTMVVVPLLGFDHTLVRLGQGGGYYDQLYHSLSRFHGQVHWVGVAFAKQELSHCPVHAHDLRLDYVITEQGLIAYKEL